MAKLTLRAQAASQGWVTWAALCRGERAGECYGKGGFAVLGPVKADWYRYHLINQG